MSAGFWRDVAKLCGAWWDEHYRPTSGWLQQSHS